MVNDHWSYLCEFIDNHKSIKIDKIKSILVDETSRMKVFALLKMRMVSKLEKWAPHKLRTKQYHNFTDF